MTPAQLTPNPLPDEDDAETPQDEAPTPKKEDAAPAKTIRRAKRSAVLLIKDMLYSLDLSYNQLSGTIPTFNVSTELRRIYLEHNFFTGTVTDQFTEFAAKQDSGALSVARARGGHSPTGRHSWRSCRRH